MNEINYNNLDSGIVLYWIKFTKQIYQNMNYLMSSEEYNFKLIFI